jgi:hypothetical protein
LIDLKSLVTEVNAQPVDLAILQQQMRQVGKSLPSLESFVPRGMTTGSEILLGGQAIPRLIPSTVMVASALRRRGNNALEPIDGTDVRERVIRRAYATFEDLSAAEFFYPPYG